MTTMELSNRLTSNSLELRLGGLIEELVDERSELETLSIGEPVITRKREMVELVVAHFKDDVPPMGLPRFLAILDTINMGHSVDLMIWLRRSRSAV